jgi:hypothetical protein
MESQGAGREDACEAVRQPKITGDALVQIFERLEILARVRYGRFQNFERKFADVGL